MAQVEYCIIGLGKFGMQVANQIHLHGGHVMAIDINQETINKAGRLFDIAIKCDATDINALIDTSIQNVKTIIVCVSSIEISSMICANLRELSLSNIIARAKNNIHERILKILGVSQVTVPEIEAANRIATKCLYNFGCDVSIIDNNLSLIKAVVTNPEIIDKNVVDLVLKDKYGANVMFIQRRDMTIFPITKFTSLKFGDITTILCHNKDIKKIIDLLTKENTGIKK